jgi:hypothetical protein
MMLKGLRGPEGPLFHGDADTCDHDDAALASFSASREVIALPVRDEARAFGEAEASPFKASATRSREPTNQR